MDTGVIFDVEKDHKNYRFKISKILPENSKETYDLFENVFYRYEPVTACLNYDKELFRKFYSSYIEFQIKNELCYMVQDVNKNNEIAAIIINNDHFNSIFNLVESTWQPKEIVEFLECQNDSIKSTKLGEVLYIDFMVCKREYWGLGLMSKLTTYVLNDAPICKDFQKYYAICTNTGSMTVCERHGFKKIETIRFDEYRNREGVNPFANLKELAEKLEIKGAEEYCVLFLEKANK